MIEHKNYWRSSAEINGELSASAGGEFQPGASEASTSDFSRRSFMKLMGAATALATGAVSCRRPEEKIIALGAGPEHSLPGEVLHFASAVSRASGVVGVKIRTNGLRPSGIGGLDSHPLSQGGTDSQIHADLLEMYDPARLSYCRFKDVAPLHEEDGMTPAFRAASRQAAVKAKALVAELGTAIAAEQGKGLAVLACGPLSLLDHASLKTLKAKAPLATIHQWHAINDDACVRADLACHGNAEWTASYDLRKADTILALDADFLANGARDGLRLARQWAERRRLAIAKGDKAAAEKADIGRLYSVESNFSLTGSNADHRLRLKPSQVAALAVHLAKALIPELSLATPKLELDFESAPGIKAQVFVDTLIADLKHGRSLVIAGDSQPTEVHILARLINEKLGAFKSGAATLVQSPGRMDRTASFNALVASLEAGAVKTLVILGGNPVFDGPSALPLAKAATSLHLSLRFNETSALCSAALPQAHWLETWNAFSSAIDADTALLSFAQPMIAPLYSGLASYELIAQLAGSTLSGRAALKSTLALDEATLDQALKQGFLETAARAVRPPAYQPAAATSLASFQPATAELELAIVPCPKLLDGSYAANSWLQELPDPITKLTWDNAALMSIGTALKLGVKDNDLVEVTADTASAILPVWRVPGIADGTVVTSFGYGRPGVTFTHQSEDGVRPSSEQIVGVDTYPLRRAGAWACTVKPTGKALQGFAGLASTQAHNAMEDRAPVKTASIASFAKAPGQFTEVLPLRAKSFFNDRPEFTHPGTHQWAMVIDLNACTGCGTCTIACQSENNVPVVGKTQVHLERSMHWIRLDRYFFSDHKWMETPGAHYDTEARAFHQPLGCQQCENAPCEQVCPVAATQHSPEGLNDMAYNRCIGTRYCANNCPFKVRRFNFFNLHEEFQSPRFEVKKMVHNPNVTVRSRGVIEKCTYCVQRINQAKIDAKVQHGGTMPTDSFTTACAEACPTKAIVFGDKNNAQSAVSRQLAEVRRYSLLPELNLRPRTHYLARLQNRAAALEGAVPASEHGDATHH